MKRKSFSNKDKENIIKYWQSNIDYLINFGYDDSKIENILECKKDKHNKYTCFACGRNTSVEVAHIVPHSLGGGDDFSNLFLLCPDCHKDSPDFIDSIYFFEWVKERKTEMTEYCDIIYSAFEKFFIPNIINKDITHDYYEYIRLQIIEGIKSNVNKSVHHAGKFSNSTRYAILRETFKNINYNIR